MKRNALALAVFVAASSISSAQNLSVSARWTPPFQTASAQSVRQVTYALNTGAGQAVAAGIPGLAALARLDQESPAARIVVGALYEGRFNESFAVDPSPAQQKVVAETLVVAYKEAVPTLTRAGRERAAQIVAAVKAGKMSAMDLKTAASELSVLAAVVPSAADAEEMKTVFAMAQAPTAESARMLASNFVESNGAGVPGDLSRSRGDRLQPSESAQGLLLDRAIRDYEKAWLTPAPSKGRWIVPDRGSQDNDGSGPSLKEITRLSLRTADDELRLKALRTILNSAAVGIRRMDEGYTLSEAHLHNDILRRVNGELRAVETILTDDSTNLSVREQGVLLLSKTAAAGRGTYHARLLSIAERAMAGSPTEASARMYLLARQIELYDHSEKSVENTTRLSLRTSEDLRLVAVSKMIDGAVAAIRRMRQGYRLSETAMHKGLLSRVRRELHAVETILSDASSSSSVKNRGAQLLAKAAKSVREDFYFRKFVGIIDRVSRSSGA